MSDLHNPTMRVVNVIQFVLENEDGYTLTEISKGLEIPIGTLYPIVNTLKSCRYLSYNEISQRYSLGIGVFEAGSHFIQESGAYERIVNIMEDIVKVCEETCHFATLDGGNVLYLAKVDSPNPIRMFSAIGKRIPAYGTAIGKAILFRYTKEEIMKLYPQGLQAMTRNTITNIDSLMDELDCIKKMGFAYEVEESNEMIRCIAIPIYKRNQVVASLSIPIPVFRYDEEKRILIESLLKEAALKVNRLVLHLNL